ENNYMNKNLTTFKPHHIIAASFNKISSASEVTLIFYMLKVAKLSTIEPEKTLLLSSGEVNADSTADKSLSETVVQSTTQPKAPTDKKSKKKKIPYSSKPKISHYIRGTASNHSQNSVGESGEDKGYPRPKKESASTHSYPIFFIHSEFAPGTDTLMFITPDVDPKNYRLGKDLQHPVHESQTLRVVELHSASGVTELQNKREHETKEDDSDRELSVANEKASDHVIDEILTEVNQKDTHTTVFAVTPNEKNIPRVKMSNVQSLGAMKRFKEIQITKVHGSDPLGDLLRRVDFLAAQVYNLAKYLPTQFTDRINSTTNTVSRIIS
ncbi:hypothetical protein Tco_0194088, partial [Tanacetum coccineum]